MPTKQKVLVFLLGSLGDSIVAIPALRTVRENFPSAEIVVLHESGGGLVEPPEVIPTSLVDRYIGNDRRSLGVLSYLRVLPRLRKERFDAAVYLVFSDRLIASVKRDAQYFRAAGIKRLIGFQPFTPAELFPTDPAGHLAKVPQEAERKLSRLERDGLRPSAQALEIPWIIPHDDEAERVCLWLREHVRSAGILALAPGCKTKANRWPVERFVEVVRAVREESDIDVVIVGGAIEEKVGDDICSQLSRCTNAAGKFSVRENAALLSLCDGYLGLDTGTTHLAAAVGTPIVAVYGQRNNPGQWFPTGNELQMIQTDVPCAGCRLQTCSLEAHPCMTGIKVSDVVPAVLGMLSRAQAPDRRLSAREAA
jgi:heptosyltransferase-3